MVEISVLVRLLLSIILVNALAIDRAVAENPEQTQQALMKAQGLLKQIALQKTKAEVDLAKAQGELTEKTKAIENATHNLTVQKATLTKAEAALGIAGKQLAEISANLEKAHDRLEKTTAKLHEVVDKYKDTLHQLETVGALRLRQEEKLTVTTRELQDAEKKNLALYQLNQNLLQKYKQKSVWDALRQREPLTGLNSVSVENQIQTLEDKAYQQLEKNAIDATKK